MEQKNNSIIIAGAIIIAGFLVALGIFASKDGGDQAGTNTAGGDVLQERDIDLEAVSAEDHIRGNRDAAVVLVEYSDFECPFCRQFHTEVKGAMETLGSDFAWVYRHFPLEQLHQKAREEANAAECVASLGGNDAFWAFADKFYELSPSNDGTDLATVLPQAAEAAGVNYSQVRTCIDSKQSDDEVQDDLDDAIAAGGGGTPYNVFVLEEEISDEAREGLAAIFREPGIVTVSPDGMRVAIGGGLPQDMLIEVVNLLKGE
jgi:protein-disulfide isomerase